ncbi:L,D-transpeptidase family protein [Pseudomonadota bacterium]
MNSSRQIKINLAEQTLSLLDGAAVICSYSISSALNGPGETMGSECTPRGLHRIKIKVGAGQPENAVFVGRRATGEIYSSELAAAHPGRDWVLCRILWLTGEESGRNRGGRVDSLRRYIYIHGCPDSEPMGRPLSHGCIRMRNRDLVTLFEQVEAGMRVDIQEEAGG